jgi:drug/metabolite transporter (DMT)-like permease
MTALSTARHPTAREQPLTLGAVTVTLILWASAFVVIRYADRYLSPGPLALARMVVGSFTLGIVMVVRRQRLPPWPAIGFAVLAGVLWFGLYNLALNAGERRIDAGTASLLVNTGPIFLALLAGALLREGFPRALFAGCLVAFGGAALITIGVSSGGGKQLWGAVLCVVAALAYAAAVVAQKPALRRAGALPIIWVGCTTAAVALLPYAPELGSQLGRTPGSAIGWTVYLGLGPTATAFVFWAFALARTDAGRLGVTTYLVPPLVVLLGWLALGEVPPLLALPGGLLCLAGVALARHH